MIKPDGFVPVAIPEQYGDIFYPDVNGPSHATPPPPGEGVSGAYPEYFYGVAGPSHEPPHPSEADQFVASISDAVFGHHWDDHSPLGGNGGNGSGNGQ